MRTKKIPVLLKGQHTDVPIGELEVDLDRLPTTYKFCFALAFRGGQGSEPLEILYVFPEADEDYFNFLKKELGR